MSTNPNDVAPTAETPENGREPTSRDRYEGQAARSTVSANKLAANRRNARRSTGPRTAEGKLNSRMNAVRHGILSSEVVVRGLRIQERADEFKALRDRCWECLAPVGPVEEMLVDKIVTAQWRMRRALTAETGEIVLSVDGGRERRANREPLPAWIFMDPTHDASLAMEKTSAGLEYLKRILEKVDQDVKRDGELTEKTLAWVRGRFMNTSNQMTRALEEYRATFLKDASAFAKASVAAGAVADKSADTSAVGAEASAFADASADTSSSATATADEMADAEGLSLEKLKEKHQTAVARYVEATLGWQADLSRQWKEREDKEETAQQAANVLPSAEVLEKIIRYEGSLERQLYRAMNQLERLQRRRDGEQVTAPLMMDVMK